MDLTIEQFERIEAYVNQQLTDAEKQTFDAELSQNEPLRSEVETQRHLRLGMRAIGIQRSLQQAQQRYRQNQTNGAADIGRVIPFQGTVRNSFFRYWAAAASVVILLGAGWLVYQNQQRVPTEVVAMAELELNDATLKAFPKDSLTYLSKQSINPRIKQQAEWYIALSLLKKDRKADARKILNRIAKDPEHAYFAKAKAILEKLD